MKITRHLQELSKTSEAVKKQFYPSNEEKNISEKVSLDPFDEEKYQPVPNLVHKYPKRVLILLANDCAAHCRFCMRKREVFDDDKTGGVTKDNIDQMVIYIKTDANINEVIFSGGDPLTVINLLDYALQKFTELEQIKIFRIHTRAPIHNPKLVSPKLLNLLQKYSKQKAFYIVLHTNHVDELTEDVLASFAKLNDAGAILLSQSVFLKGINDNIEVLEDLFNKLVENRVKPYYIHHGDPVAGSEHFVVDIKKEVEIMTQLRLRVSGLAYPMHVVDVADKRGKVPIGGGL